MIDAAYRLMYRLAYKLMKAYWKARRPLKHGALVAIWHEGRVLIVKNSYVDYYSLPGGYVKRGERAWEAAARELREELALDVDPKELALEVDVTHDWEGRRDHVVIFDLHLDYAPAVQVDNREVVAAEFLTPEQALARKLFPPLRKHVEQRALGFEPSVA
jgi:8-oxo-dGTP pyrophosphatase MutT (NUDIX family)